MIGRVMSFLGGFIQTASGTLGGRGGMPLKQAGWAAPAALSVTDRSAVSAAERP